MGPKLPQAFRGPAMWFVGRNSLDLVDVAVSIRTTDKATHQPSGWGQRPCWPAVKRCQAPPMAGGELPSCGQWWSSPLSWCSSDKARKGSVHFVSLDGRHRPSCRRWRQGARRRRTARPTLPNDPRPRRSPRGKPAARGPSCGGKALVRGCKTRSRPQPKIRAALLILSKRPI